MGKKRKHRSSLEAGWKVKMKVALTVCLSLSLTKTAFSNNPIVFITIRRTDSKRGFSPVCYWACVRAALMLILERQDVLASPKGLNQ